jgi:hypothetical protein
MSDTADWSLLPDDITETIFGILTLLELARISPTCRSFHALYCQRMAAQQKSLCNLALRSFGHGCINRIAGLIKAFFKGGFDNPAFASWSFYWVCPEGVMHKNVLPYEPKLGSTNVSFYLVERRSSYYHSSCYHVIQVRPPNNSMVFFRFPNRRSTIIQICPESDGDVEGLALVQALLTGGLARFMCDSGRRAEINFRLPDDPDPAKFTLAGMKDQIGPLMPFASRYTCVGRSGGGLDTFEPRIHIERAARQGFAPIWGIATCVVRGATGMVKAVAHVPWGFRHLLARLIWAF